MKQLFIASLGLFTWLTFFQSTAALGQQQRYDPCKIFGTIYFTNDRAQADFTVFIEEEEAFSDVLVYKEESQIYADQPGIWFIVRERGLADYYVYREDVKGRANFSIYYTNTRSFAGCR